MRPMMAVPTPMPLAISLTLSPSARRLATETRWLAVSGHLRPNLGCQGPVAEPMDDHIRHQAVKAEADRDVEHARGATDRIACAVRACRIGIGSLPSPQRDADVMISIIVLQGDQDRA